MKLNKLSMMLAALAFVGCSSEDVSEFTATQTVEDSNLIQLDPNFMLAGVGEEGELTRTHWEWVNPLDHNQGLQNKFLPIYAVDADGTKKLSEIADLEAEAVGLCWLGQGAVGANVYTNYEFYHYGWLNNGADKPVFDCGNLTNGSLYSEITPGTGSTGNEADPATDFVGGIPAKSLRAGVDNLNYNSGIYQTDNKAIFGGQYIVYYPYNEDFKDQGTIPAKAETKFDNVSTAFDTKEIGKATFRYSSPATIQGGDKAAEFEFKNLSAIAMLRVSTPTNIDLSTKSIDQIVLYSPSQKLLKQANLAADKIAAGLTGTDLYASTEGTKTIVANFTTPVAIKKINASPTSAYITVLPTTVDDLEVLVHRTDGKWARISKPNTEFIANSAKVVDISVVEANFNTDYIAVDEASLTKALTDARTAIGSTTARKTITVIGDITLGSTPYDINQTRDNQITIQGDAIIVPEDVTLQLKANTLSNIRILGKSCCSGTNGGILEVYGGMISNVTMEPSEYQYSSATKNPKVIYNGPATVAAGKTFDAQAGTIEVNSAVAHKGDINIASGVTLTVNGSGDLNFMGGTVVNNGTIEVMKNGNFDMTDSNGNATATDGQRMTNNGKFIHNVDAGVGTAVQSMNQNGEYRCKVDEQIKLDDALLQWTACSVIEMVNTGAYSYNLGTAASITPNAYQHKGKYINFEVNSGAVTTFNNPASGDSKNIMIGNLTVNTGGLDIDYVTGSGKRTLTVNGNMAVYAATTIVDSKKITVTENLNVYNAPLTYKGNKKNEQGLAVTKDINVRGTAGVFDAGEIDALNITCANFYLNSRGSAIIGNRTNGDTKNLVVSGTISNPANCTFNIKAANDNGAGSVLGWVTCSQLNVGGNFPNSRPRVE